MLQRILLLAVLWVVFAGCHSEERKAYDYAKEEGKSDFYAKAYAEQIAEGKGKIYAEAYAFALDTAFNNKFVETRLPDDKTKKIFAKIYAQEVYDGQTVTYAAKYARIYCDMIPIAIETGRDERFIHQFTRHFIRGENEAKKLFPQQSSEYIESFSMIYAMERTEGTTNEQAVKKAMDYANAKHKRNR